MKAKILVAVTLITASTLASAQWYGGISAGTSNVPLKDSDVAVTGATTSSVQKNESATGFKLQAGYQFNKNFALEGGYVNLGKANATRNVTAPASGSLRGEVSADGWNMMAVGFVPATEKLSLLGKLGGILSTTKGEYSTTGAVTIVGATSSSKSELNPAYGLGLQYAVSEKLALRAELDSFIDLRAADNGNKRSVDLYSVGLYMKF